MSDEVPEFVYRGTTQSRIDENLKGSTFFPVNWTGSSAQALSYAAGYSLGDSHNNVPVVVMTEYDEEAFSEGEQGVPTKLDRFEIDDFSPQWYRFLEPKSAFDSEEARNEALEMFDINELDEFLAQHVTREVNRDAARSYFKTFTDFERYEDQRQDSI